jgi:8-oxo-dGTP pyrophosphatase MutT (NUDIX family)
MSEARERVVRRAARVVLVDGAGRVLLIRGQDPARPEAGTWWICPGGGADDGESLEDAARREVLEETGLTVGDLGPVVLEREVGFEFDGLWVQQAEVFYLVRGVAGPELDTSGWNDLERRALLELRWWPVTELVGTSEIIYPEALPNLLQQWGIG